MRRLSGCPRNLLTLCLITDRLRLVAQLSAPAKDWAAIVRAQIRGAVAGGVNVVQIRERGLEDRDYATFVRDCVRLTRGTSTRVVVNDRLDLALAVDADGVHLREGSVSIETVRPIVPKEFLIGRSIHDAATAVAARTADYMIAGSVFETASKPGREATLGLDGLRAVVQAAGRCPVWAVGGVTGERIPAIRACGVSGVAAIGAFFPPKGARDVAAAVQATTTALRFSLDRAAELP